MQYDFGSVEFVQVIGFVFFVGQCYYVIIVFCQYIDSQVVYIVGCVGDDDWFLVRVQFVFFYVYDVECCSKFGCIECYGFE